MTMIHRFTQGPLRSAMMGKRTTATNLSIVMIQTVPMILPVHSVHGLVILLIGRSPVKDVVYLWVPHVVTMGLVSSAPHITLYAAQMAVVSQIIYAVQMAAVRQIPLYAAQMAAARLTECCGNICCNPGSHCAGGTCVPDYVPD